MAKTSTLLLLLAATLVPTPAFAATMIRSTPTGSSGTPASSTASTSVSPAVQPTPGRQAAANAQAAPEARIGKPILLIEQPRSQSNANRMLYDRLRTAARNRLTRFDLAESSSGADLTVVAEFLLEPTVEVDRKASAQEYERKDSSGKTVKDTRIVETIEYKSNAEVDVRITDSRTGAEDLLHVVKTGVSSSSTGEARESAFDGIVRQILDALRSKHTLSAVVTRKEGRSVTLDRGFNAGIERNGYFAAIDPDGREIGEVRVERVERERAVGRIRDGYYRIGEGTRLSEKLWGVPPRGLSIGVVNRLLVGGAPSIDQTFLGLEGHWRQADPDGWFDVVLEGDFLTRYDPPTSQVIPGGALFASFVPQVEIVPEWLWLQAPLGLGFSTFWSAPVTPGVDASVTTFHLLAGLGATVNTPWHFRLSADGGVMSPWTVTGIDWRTYRGKESSPANTGIGFTTGGLFGRLSLTYGF